MKKVKIVVVPNTIGSKTIEVDFSDLDTSETEWQEMTDKDKNGVVNRYVNDLDEQPYYEVANFWSE